MGFYQGTLLLIDLHSRYHQVGNKQLLWTLCLMHDFCDALYQIDMQCIWGQGKQLQKGLLGAALSTG